ncbi:MAG: helix-turn-helix transcriptional regulator [Oscillospiraceae bacterium]|nr:helix-turn-helix transcriptional regulator [Oscillospiraceae bacterium]
MTDVERIRQVCKEHGIPIARLEEALGYGNGYLNPKKIETVTVVRAKEIAAYIGISLGELTGEQKKTPAGTAEANISASEQELLDAYRAAPPEIRGIVDHALEPYRKGDTAEKAI